MSRLLLPTRALVALLKDTVCCTGKAKDFPALATVLLHCDRGEWVMEEKPEKGEGTEPLIETIESPLLVATATNGESIVQAHTWIESGGALHKPVLLSAIDVRAIIGVFRPLVSTLEDKQVHNTQIELEGDEITFEEDPQQVPGGFAVSASLVDLAEYPREIVRLLSPDPAAKVKIDGKTIEPSYGTGVHEKYLKMAADVSRRRGMPVAWYRHHQRKGIVVEVGAAWRGVIMPQALDEENGQHLAPTVRVFDPGLKAPAETPKTQPLPV